MPKVLKWKYQNERFIFVLTLDTARLEIFLLTCAPPLRSSLRNTLGLGSTIPFSDPKKGKKQVHYKFPIANCNLISWRELSSYLYFDSHTCVFQTWHVLVTCISILFSIYRVLIGTSAWSQDFTQDKLEAFKQTKYPMILISPEACSANKSRTVSDRPTISTAETRTENLVPVLKRGKQHS